MDTKALSRRIRELMRRGMTRQEALSTIIAEGQLAVRELERRRLAQLEKKVRR